MIKTEYKNIKIDGISCCVPESYKKTEEWKTVFGEEKVDKFQEISGVNQLHIAIENQTASDLSYLAAERLLKHKSVDRDEIGVLIFVSETPDYKLPSTAFVLQKRLQLSKNCVCFDVNLGCSGFVFGLNIVASLLNSMNIKKGLLLFGDTLSKKISPQDRSVCMLVGDAGGAVLLTKTDYTHRLQIAMQSDGNNYHLVGIPAGGSRYPHESKERRVVEDGNIRSLYDFYMDGANVFFFSTFDMVKFFQKYMQENEKQSEDYDALIMHQANKYIINTFTKKIKFPAEKVPVSIHKFGNTVGSCIPLTLSDHYAELNEEKNFLMFGFGIGMSWGIVDTVIDCRDIFPVMYSDEYYKEDVWRDLIQV